MSSDKPAMLSSCTVNKSFLHNGLDLETRLRKAWKTIDLGRSGRKFEGNEIFTTVKTEMDEKCV